MNTKIFIVAHRPLDYELWENSLYQPIQVGSAPDFLSLRDNTADNISEWNEIFAENTAHYWIAKNVKDQKYLGVCQYRRRLYFEEDFDFDAVFKDYYAIAPMPLYISQTVKEQFCMCHSAVEWAEVEDIVKTLYPYYAKEWDRIMDSHILFYASSFIMRAEDFRQYVDFFYNVAKEFFKRHNIHTPDDAKVYTINEIAAGRRKNWQGLKYQAQIIGFICERLLGFWLQKDNKPLYIVDYTKFEGV